MYLLRTSTALAALVLLLAACGQPAATDANGPTEAPEAEEPQDNADGGPATASVELTVTGGEFAGSYSGSVPDGGCSKGATGENTFGLQYSTADEDVAFSSVQLIVNDASAAAGGTDDFLTTVTMGPLLEGTTLQIDPPEESGTGTVTLDDRGDTATILIAGETAEGVGIDVTVTCHSVLDFGEF